MSGFDDLNATLPGYAERKARGGASQIPGQSGFDRLNAGLHQHVTAAANPADNPVTDDDFQGSTLQAGPFDTHIPIPASVGRGLAQIGSGMADLPLRGRQLVNYMRGLDTTGEVDEKKALDARLNTGFTGTLNSVLGSAIPYALTPEMRALDRLGAVAPVVRSAATGALQGAGQPTGTGDSTLANVAAGTMAGTAAPGVGATAKSILGSSTPYARDLAQSAIAKYSIPIGVGDVSQNRFVKSVGSFLDNTGINAGNNQAKQDAFNKAAMTTMGEHTGADKLTPDVIAANKARIGKDFDTVWNQNNLTITPKLLADMDALRAKAQRFPSSAAHDVDAHLADLDSKIVYPQSGQPYIPGDVANNFQSGMYSVNPKSKSDELINEMRGHILNNFNAQVTPESAALNNQARAQYRALKTLQPIAVSNDNQVAGRMPGDIAPSQLSSAVTKNYPNSNSPFEDLPKIGQTLINKGVPETGGSAKALLQAIGLSGGSALGASVGNALGVGPVEAALLGAGGVAGLGFGANTLLKSPGIYKIVADLAEPASPGVGRALKTLVGDTALRVPSAGALALTEAGAEKRREADALSGSLATSPDTDNPSPVQGALDATAPLPLPSQ